MPAETLASRLRLVNTAGKAVGLHKISMQRRGRLRELSYETWQEMDIEDGEAPEIERHDDATESVASGLTASAGAATVSPYTSIHDF